jgi:hypothetical protein
VYVFMYRFLYYSIPTYFQRSERSGRGDDSSPARLTMAQAALLNLRGQQMQGRLRAPHHPNNLPDQRRLVSAQSQADVHDIPGVQYHQHSRLPPHPIVSLGQSEPENNLSTTSRTVPARLHGRTDSQSPGGLPISLGSDIDLSALSRAAGANGFTPLEQQLILQARLHAEIDAHKRAFFGSQSNSPLPGGPMQTRSLHSDQAEELPRSLNNLSLRSALPAKEFIPRGSAPRLDQSHGYNSVLSSRLSVDLLPSEVVDDHHASMSHSSQQPQCLAFPSCQQQPHGSANAINSRVLGLASKDTGLKHNDPSLIADKDSAVYPSNSLDLVSDSADLRVSTRREDQQNLAAHMRSTTLPPHFTVGAMNATHNTGAVSLRLNGILSPTLPPGAGVSGAGIGDRGHVGKLNIGGAPTEQPINREIDTIPSDVKLMHPHNPVADSPFLIPSPALTYNSSSSASSRTPSTLSPSTPFFGSFPHPGDSFGAYNGEEHGADKTDATLAHEVTSFDIGTKIRSGSGWNVWGCFFAPFCSAVAVFDCHRHAHCPLPSPQKF